MCALALPQPFSSLHASAVESFAAPAAELALAVQLIRLAARICPNADPIIPLVAPSNARLGGCALASIGAIVAMNYAAAERDASNTTLSSQILSDLSTLSAALFAPTEKSLSETRSAAVLSETISELLRRSVDWAPVLEQSLHAHAVAAIQQLVSRVTHPHMSSCVDAILPVICEICCHYDVAHRGVGARCLLHVMSQADKVVLRQHKDRILKVCSAFVSCPA